MIMLTAPASRYSVEINPATGLTGYHLTTNRCNWVCYKIFWSVCIGLGVIEGETITLSNTWGRREIVGYCMVYLQGNYSKFILLLFFNNTIPLNSFSSISFLFIFQCSIFAAYGASR